MPQRSSRLKDTVLCIFTKHAFVGKRIDGWALPILNPLVIQSMPHPKWAYQINSYRIIACLPWSVESQVHNSKHVFMHEDLIISPTATVCEQAHAWEA